MLGKGMLYRGNGPAGTFTESAVARILTHTISLTPNKPTILIHCHTVYQPFILEIQEIDICRHS